jgi:eukaryotic-like serine/threonine-protein kinase
MSADSSGMAWRLRDLSAAEYSRLSELLDSCLALPPEERTDWLSQLESEDRTAEILRRLFATSDSAGFGTLLETGEVLTRHLASLARGEETFSGRRVGAYRVLSLLGQGGMGSVWLAERADGLFARQVALKLVHPVLMARQVTERFAREREILASLNHPHIARLLDAGFADDGQPYLALQYVAGTPLTTFCDTRRLSVRERLRLFQQVLGAVQYAHAHLVIHRDLKPSNILVTDDGQVQLLDFGIAKLLIAGEARETELTQLGGRALTPDYAAPEQLTGDPITTAADVYSLGVMLFELLTGQRPYPLKRESRGALEDAVVSAEPLRRDIDNYLAGQPVVARPDTFWYRSAKFVRRNRLAVLASAAVATSLVGGLGVALLQARRASDEARVAKAVQTFLQSVFEANTKDQTNPLKAQQTTARELLDIGAANIDRGLADSPRAKLEVLATLVRMHHHLGLNERAVELGRKRAALARRLFGPNDRRVAEALRDLSLDLPATKAASEQRAAVLEALAILDRNGESSSPLRANLLGDLAQYYQEHDLGKSLDYAEQSVAMLRRYPPTEDLEYGLELLGSVHTQRGEYAQAEPALAEALRISKQVHGDPNAHLPQLYAYLAEARYFLQNFQGAEQSYRDGYLTAHTLLGDAHVDTMQLGIRLGQFLCRIGHAREGLAYLKTANDAAMRREPADDPVSAALIAELYGWELARFGPLESGLTLVTQATDQWRKLRPSSDWDLSAFERSAYLLTDVGEYRQALALLDEASAIRTRLHDETTYPNGNVVGRVKLLLALGQADEAERALMAYRVQPAPPGGVSMTELERSLWLAEIALSRRDFPAARALAERTHETILHSNARAYLRPYEARAELARGLALLGPHASPQAVELLRESVHSHGELYDPQTSLLLANARLALAQALRQSGHRREARAELERAAAIHARHPALGEHLRRPLEQAEAELGVTGAGTNRVTTRG